MVNLSLCAKRYSALQEVSLLVNNRSTSKFHEFVFLVNLKLFWQWCIAVSFYQCCGHCSLSWFFLIPQTGFKTCDIKQTVCSSCSLMWFLKVYFKWQMQDIFCKYRIFHLLRTVIAKVYSGSNFVNSLHTGMFLKTFNLTLL